MDKKEWTPADLLQMSGSYWSACALHAGVKLDLFSPLAERSLTAAELARHLKLDARGLDMLLNALAALNLLAKSGDCYAAGGFAAQYLARQSPQYLGYIILHHHHLMSGWARLDQAVSSGKPVRESVSHGEDEAARESFEMGMFNLAMLQAPKIMQKIDLAGRRRLLDLGGGPGTYAVNFCLHNPDLTAVVYDLPSTRQFAEATINRFGMSGRISFQPGDFLFEEVEGCFDVVWLSHILHGEGPEGCRILLEKAVAVMERGGLILVQEFILDDSRDSPLFPALFSLNMLLGTSSGQAYSRSELVEMMTHAGIHGLHRLDLDLPNGAGIIVGTI